MADFGQTGVITVTTSKSDVMVNGAAQEHLIYKLTVKGGMPDFVFTCRHQERVPITSADRFQGHPKQVYEWRLWKILPNSPSPTDFATDSVPKDDFAVGMSFLGATEYTLLIEHRDQNEGLIETVQSINYKSQTPSDTALEGLRVNW